MSSASSNQSFVCDGAGYEELYLSGYRDPDELSERSWLNQRKVLMTVTKELSQS